MSDISYTQLQEKLKVVAKEYNLNTKEFAGLRLRKKETHAF